VHLRLTRGCETDVCSTLWSAELSRHNPQGRLVTPAEVADTVLWLCGQGSSAITGQAIAVAGGEVQGAQRSSLKPSQ
jgi:NAD(P)-dependent dehydrogenase (short-subunit alcohol dehydrogenase family)